MKEEPGTSPMEEGKEISEVLKTEDKRNETERKSATQEEIDEVCFPLINFESVLPCLCLYFFMPFFFH